MINYSWYNNSINSFSQQNFTSNVSKKRDVYDAAVGFKIGRTSHGIKIVS